MTKRTTLIGALLLAMVALVGFVYFSYLNATPRDKSPPDNLAGHTAANVPGPWVQAASETCAL